MFPKPKKGSGTAARRARKRRLDKHRDIVNDQVCERDGKRCQCSCPPSGETRGGICGQYTDHAHHVFGRAGNPDHSFEQAESRLCLCNDCHYNHHHVGDISREDLIRDLERVLGEG